MIIDSFRTIFLGLVHVRSGSMVFLANPRKNRSCACCSVCGPGPLSILTEKKVIGHSQPIHDVIVSAHDVTALGYIFFQPETLLFFFPYIIEYYP